MKIERVETFQADAGWRMFSFLKVTTDDGIIGWSEFNESFGSIGLSDVIRGLSPVLIGKRPTPIRTDHPAPARAHAPVARRHQPAGDRGDRERAARRDRQGLRRAGLCAVRRTDPRPHPGLLVAFRHLPRAQCGADGRAGAEQLRRPRTPCRGGEAGGLPRAEDQHHSDRRRQDRHLMSRASAARRAGRNSTGTTGCCAG